MTNHVEAGLAAFRAGKFEDALAHFEDAERAAPLPDQALLAFAAAARSLSRFDTCLDAVDRFLKTNPAHAQALLIKADAFQALGKTRYATGFYQAFLRVMQTAQPAPAHLQGDVLRAQQACQAAAKDYEDYLRSEIAAAGIANDGRSRTSQAIEIMLGKKTIYTQSPSKFFFPELPHIQFYEADDFPWAREIVEQADVVRSELSALLETQEEFSPYVEHNINAPKMSSMGQQLMGRRDWSAYHFHKDSIAQPERIARCPRTLEILTAAPVPEISTVSPSILFSRLTAGAHIPPHAGVCNARLICHLPLITPKGCWLRVGNQVREWTDGEMLIFDDTIEHEAKNPTAETRIILLFDIWRPELRDDERRLIETVFNAVGSYQEGAD